jgi:type I restriction enzyme S subunit
MGLIRPDPAKLDPHYLLYYFLSPEFQDLIRARTIAGSTVERILIQEVPSFPILIPTLAEQRAIARILGALDNKIELSRRMNRTLEAMAQALFKSWFVDFDPVTAKAAGLQPHGMNAETAALFPVRFHDSQLGSIPEAWKVGIISDLAQVTSGKRPGARSKIKSAEKSIPLFGSGGIMGYVSEPLYSSPTLVTGRVGTLGQIFRFSKPCWPSDNTLVTNAQIPHYHEFLYFQLLQVDFDSITRGSTQPLVTQSDLQAQKIVIAPETIIEAFHKITDSLLSRIDYNDNENSTLANIRDALLPRLLSGELRLRQAEKVLETIE